jgi:hypothetical protein
MRKTRQYSGEKRRKTRQYSGEKMRRQDNTVVKKEKTRQ